MKIMTKRNVLVDLEGWRQIRQEESMIIIDYREGSVTLTFDDNVEAEVAFKDIKDAVGDTILIGSIF